MLRCPKGTYRIGRVVLNEPSMLAVGLWQPSGVFNFPRTHAAASRQPVPLPPTPPFRSCILKNKERRQRLPSGDYAYATTIGVLAAFASKLDGITRRKSSRLTGLVRKAFMPTARHSSFTPVSA